MQKDNPYTRIDDQQIITKTNKSSREWYKILDDYQAPIKKGATVCQFLIDQYGLSKYWARTIYIRYQWERDLRTG